MEWGRQRRSDDSGRIKGYPWPYENQCIITEEEQILPPQNTPHWRKNYFVLKTIEKKQI